MNKLYDLVNFRIELVKYLKSCQENNSVQQKFNQLNNFKFNNPSIKLPNLDIVLEEYQDLISKEEKILELLKNSIVDIETNINEVGDNLDNFYKEKFTEDNTNILTSSLSDIEIESIVESTITKFNSHLYPSLQINPKEKKWIDCMIGSDPLYLASHNYEKLINLIQDYPKLYQNRLRLYKILNINFSILPQNQFGFVLCWDTFYYLSHEKVEQYIQKIFKLLRPGGILMFNYNNSDLKECAEYVEYGNYAHMSFSLLKKIINKFDFELINHYDLETKDNKYRYLSWIEIKKPGELQTIKTSQAIAQILSK